jgi:hypothetical protein
VANTGPNFGTDLAVAPDANGILDISPMLTYATGIQVLIQSLMCRQMCVKGSIVGAPNEGIDVRTYVRQGLTQEVLGKLPSVLQKELQRDERVKTATVTGGYDTARNTLTLNEVFETTLGPFSLTLEVSAVTVTLLGSTP